jgi:hypothetical protein
MLHQSDRPRAHHYSFGHRLLPGLALRGRTDFHELASRALLDQLLRGWWQELGESLPAEERLPHDGLRSELVNAGNVAVVLVTMPAAAHAAEAHFVAVTPHVHPDAWRCFTLEHTWTLDDQPATVLAEWTADGHVNYGDGPPPERQAFLDALGLLVAGPPRNGSTGLPSS